MFGADGDGAGGNPAHIDGAAKEGAFYPVFAVEATEAGGFAGGEEAGDGFAIGSEDAAGFVDLDATEAFADEDKHGCGVEGGLGDFARL